ncbi:MAG: hypothetical protein KC493_11235 [Bacteriovoracaceae bacterium]|nr:hypothetical protein [Bacteriovoracaceae bacterium]
MVKRIGIIGAGSSLGKNLIDVIAPDSEFVSIAFQRKKPNKKALSKTEFHPIFKGVPKETNILKNLSAVVYCIGTNLGNEKDINYINITLLENFLKALPKEIPIIFISSVSVIYQKSVYSDAKKYAEHLISKIENPYTIIRPSLLYGKYDDKNLVSLSKKVSWLPIVPSPPKEHIIQPVNMEELSLFIFKLIKDQSIKNQILVCSNSNHISAYEVIKKICRNYSSFKLVIPIPLSIIKLCSSILSMIMPSFDLSTQLQNMEEHPPFDSKEAESLGYKCSKFKGVF